MASIIEYYLLFCFTTTITLLLTEIIPLVKMLDETYPKPKVLVNSSKTFLIILLFIFMFILAPVMFIVYTVPNYSERFKRTIYEELSKE